MIRFTCPHCKTRLNAKDEVAGKTRKCPQCGRLIIVTAEDSEAGLESQIQPPREDYLPAPKLPRRLNRESHYLICDRSRLAATWENKGNGWMYDAGAGFLSAKRCRDQLPAAGDFQLVELMFSQTSEGKQLSGLKVYRLASRWALTALDQGDDAIAEKITGLGCLNREQKNIVRQALKDQFMRPVWENAEKVLEFLGNTDYHSPGVF